MDGRYLIPANSKKSMLIFGLFNGGDLFIFSVGVGTSLLLLMIVAPTETLDTFLVLLFYHSIPGCTLQDAGRNLRVFQLTDSAKHGKMKRTA